MSVLLLREYQKYGATNRSDQRLQSLYRTVVKINQTAWRATRDFAEARMGEHCNERINMYCESRQSICI